MSLPAPPRDPGLPALPSTPVQPFHPRPRGQGGTRRLGGGGATPRPRGDPGLTSSPLPPTPAVEVDPGLEPESAEYLVALEHATAALEQCVNLCKAHVMMVTCFDISAAAPATAPGPQEVDV